MRIARTPLLCLALLTGALASCSSSSSPRASHAPIESLDEALTRVAPAMHTGAVHQVDEPSQYRINYDVYFQGHTKGEVAGEGARQRRLLDGTATYRRVVRPFDESGAVSRTLGFARGTGGAVSRVTLLRPLAEDPRPRLYPPTSPPTAYHRVAGRVCASYVIDGDEYCVDGAGLVLITRTHASLEVATKVTTGGSAQIVADIADGLAKGFTAADRGSIRPVDPDTAPAGATDYSLDNPPDGFTLVGRYAVVPLTGELLNRTRKIVAGIVDVYVRGVDSVFVERGGKLDLSTVGDDSLGSLLNGQPVDLGQLGAGTVGIAGIGPFGYREVRATPSPGRYVVVAGTVSQDELVTLAQSLHAWPGTQLRYLDHLPASPPPQDSGDFENG